MKLQLKAKSSKEAIIIYLEILYKFHKLTGKEVETLAEIIHIYNNLLTKYDKSIAEKLYLDKDSRKSILAALDMTGQVFRNYLVTFKKKGVISGGLLHKAFIPNLNNIKLEFNITYEK